jgi:hypothetical protein
LIASNSKPLAIQCGWPARSLAYRSTHCSLPPSGDACSGLPPVARTQTYQSLVPPGITCVQLITSGPSGVTKRQSTVQILGRGAGLLVVTVTVLLSGEIVQLKAEAGAAEPIASSASATRCSTFHPP